MSTFETAVAICGLANDEIGRESPESWQQLALKYFEMTEQATRAAMSVDGDPVSAVEQFRSELESDYPPAIVERILAMAILENLYTAWLHPPEG